MRCRTNGTSLPVLVVVLSLAAAYPAFAQEAPVAVRIDRVDVLSPELVRVAYTADGDRQTLELPADVLAQLVRQIGSAGTSVSPPPPTQPSAERSSSPKRVGAVRAHSKITGLTYHATIVADSVVTIRYDRAGVQQVVSLPPDLFPLLERHHRALTGRLRDSEAQIWLDDATGIVHFGFMRGFDYRVVLAVLAIFVGILVMVLIRLAIWRIRRERDELLASRHRMAKVREDERSYLASELHDGPIQDLQRILRSYMGGLSTMSTDEQKAKLAEIEGDLREVAGSLRGICSDLKPPVLVHFGLAPAIEAYSAEFRGRNPGIDIDLNLGVDAGQLSMELRLVLYRIFQEALTNVEKHASATRIMVQLRRKGDMVRLSVQDDGAGFKVPARILKLEQSGHYGLSGMLQRARAIDGTLDVFSRPGSGTHVLVQVPYMGVEEEAAAPSPEGVS